MLRIQMIGLAIVAALFMSAVAAGSAFAAHEWLLGGASIGSATKVHSLGLLLVIDHTAPLGETVIHCHRYDAGTVGPGAADLVESITKELLGTNDVIECTLVKAGGCKAGTIAKALAIHLPWKTELYLEGAELRDMTTADGNGEPGWAVTCTNILGGSTTDTCTTALGSVGVQDVAAGVETTFDAKTPFANCKVGSETIRNGAGLVRGSVLQENPAGKLLLAI